MNDHPKVCVVGSINMDMVTAVDKMPGQGETVLGGTFRTNPGGKGANQAVAAARLGAEVSLVGAIGDDPFGKMLLKHFDLENIKREGIQIFSETSTGIATIIISENDNRIIVSSGANSKLTPEIVEASKEVIIKSDIILLQFEIPMETISYIVNLGYEHHIPVIVNPAPYKYIPENILTKATFFTPNEGEAFSMRSMPLYESITNKLITTKGKHGAEFITPTCEVKSVHAYAVSVKDTTGAGDTFNGAFAVEIARGKSLSEAINFANAAAALSVGKVGAQAGMPKRDEVNEFLVKVQK
ncbi:ribokinase [Oceanobacillus damuensis]|uniref:ribokinase n=1 Tax=Oceanobacillus damuensis TaxID=937928 RepID=UPI00082EEF0A|nr:ribokinase [Oceanobacillus damuensis]